MSESPYGPDLRRSGTDKECVTCGRQIVMAITGRVDAEVAVGAVVVVEGGG